MSLPGPYTPADIKRIFGSVEKAIKSNLVAIDWWEAEESLYFIRPRVEGVDDLYDPSWGGECIHLTDTGCNIPFDNRPTYCKALKPKKYHDCDDSIGGHNSKYRAAIQWKKSKIDLSNWRK